jgi:segregation and condensation protein B
MPARRAAPHLRLAAAFGILNTVDLEAHACRIEPLMSQPPRPESDPLGLEGFRASAGEGGLSLEDLTSAFAEMLNSGEDPYVDPAADAPDAGGDEAAGAYDVVAGPDGDPCQLSPRSILEAILFVGRPDNAPITSREVAALMRGVRPAEIDELVQEINQAYLENGSAYHIASEGPGYRLVLCSEYAYLRNRFRGKLREARLSQAAIDVLAIVAYNQPLSADEVARLRGKPSSALLSQLVRRQLLRLDRPADNPKKPTYATTPRFLDLFGLGSLDELPRHQESERE